MIRRTNLSYVPTEREAVAYTIYVNVTSLVARAALFGRSLVGEVEMTRYRKPEGNDNWSWVNGKAKELNRMRRAG